MKNRIDIMLDLETLGKQEDPPIIQLAAVAFDLDTGEIIEEYNEYCSLTDVNNIEGDTLLWWLKTNPELLTEIIDDSNHSSFPNEKELYLDFRKWVSLLREPETEVYLWGNGILFDNRILQEKCFKYGLQYPVGYNADRDMRTIVDLAAAKSGITIAEYRQTIVNDKEHDALSDVKYQTKIVCQAWKELMR